MKYFIIPKEIANELNIDRYRHGNGADGYIVNSGDLAIYGVERAIEHGAREVTAEEAREFVNNNK
jgi:hypothetical protein